jgi:radical SAM superfamily enzyme YgiQ (UPF0313 family)
MNASVTQPGMNAAARERTRPIMLVGFQKQGNLGLGYLSAVLRDAGWRVEVLDIELPVEEIVDAISEAGPLLVGFSLIFQFYIRRYGAIMRELRDAGVCCHFTMGGHYPSLSSRQTLLAVPELDSVVRFEGEITLRELADALAQGQDWTTIPGVVHRSGDQVVVNCARPLVEDLDSLPYPERNFEPEAVLGHRAMPLLASRGCARTCSFCSIHTFYRTAPGKVVRTRRPVAVVQEMQMLHARHGITIFLFQDDDFPLFGKKWRAWASEFVDELHRSGLVGKVIWKINCRADAVEAELFARMRDAGLYIVYMGLESGTEEGLATLNKGITVAQNLQAVRTLKELGIMFEFGFMLLDPSSTFESVRGNVGFLREIVGDGCASATFCKMLPYDGTPIKDALEQEERLKGDVCAPDYDFLDPRVDAFYATLARIVDVTGWIHGNRALTPQLNWAWNELAVIRKLFPALPDSDEYEAALRRITSESNEKLFGVVERVAHLHETDKGRAPDPQVLRRHCDAALKRLLQVRNAFIGRNQDVMIRSLQRAA